MLPYVFVLDWDGTIAGRVDFQSQVFSLIQALKKHGLRPAKGYTIPHGFMPNSRLIRPGFTGFLKAMREMYPNVFFFIYTASEKAWAHHEIGIVERTHGIRFARPLFTRDDCSVDEGGNYRKSLARVWPRICRTIGKEMGLVLTREQRLKILEEQLVIIDNNAVYTDRGDKMLLCPDYNYVVYENIHEYVTPEARKHPVIAQMLLSMANQGFFCPHPDPRHSEDHMDAITEMYGWIATKCRTIHTMNRAYARDQFWRHLKRLIQKNELRVFSPRVVRKLQEAVWAQMRREKAAAPAVT